MKNVSKGFIEKSCASKKYIKTHILVAWDKTFDPERGFFTLEASKLDGGAVLWNGNQDVAAFGDRYEYTEESENCASWNTSLKASQHPWGVIQGSAKIVLNNASGRYFPQNDPLIGEFVGLPNRPIKIAMEVDGETVNVFTGYSERPVATIQNSKITISAFDAISFLSGMTSDLEPITNKRIDEIIELLLLEAGFTESQFSLEEGIQESIGFCAPNGEKTLSLIRKLCESEQYLLFADGDGLIHGWNANHFTIESRPVRSFDTGNSTAMSWASSSILNYVRTQAQPYKVADNPGFFYNEEGSGDDTLVEPHDSLTVFISPEDDKNNAVYGLEFEAPSYGEKEGASYYLTSVDEKAKNNTDETNNEAGETGVINAGDNHDAIKLTNMYNFGKTIQLVFYNSSDVPTHISKIALFGKYARKIYYSAVEVKDKKSINDYGINPDESSAGEIYEVENEFIQDRKFAKRAAELLVDDYSEPYGQLSLSVFPTPYIEFGDIVGVDTGTVDGEKRGIVFGMEMSGNTDGKYTQKLSVEQRPEIYSFVLNSSKLDSGDVLAY